MNILFGLIIFILGLGVGSFLNVVILRVHAGKDFISGRSACPYCQKKLTPLDLIPVISFLFLRGRCRYCQKKISWQYPLMELATGMVFLLIYLSIDVQLIPYLPTLIFYLIAAGFLVVIFVYDLKYGLILDQISIPAIIFVFIGNLLLGRDYWDLLLGIAIGGGVFLLQWLVSKGKWIGGGDLRLGVFMGALLGWEKVLAALFFAYIIGAIWALGLLTMRKKQWNDSLPFGTFLTVATLISLLFGTALINWYVNLLYGGF